MFTYSVIFRSILASAMHYPTITFDPSRPSGEKRAASEYYPEVSITNHSITRRKRKVRAARIHGYIRPQFPFTTCGCCTSPPPLVRVRHAYPLPLRKSVEHSARDSPRATTKNREITPERLTSPFSFTPPVDVRVNRRENSRDV